MKLPRIVYAIQHNMTKRIYVGSSATQRHLIHIMQLRIQHRLFKHFGNMELLRKTIYYYKLEVLS